MQQNVKIKFVANTLMKIDVLMLWIFSAFGVDCNVETNAHKFMKLILVTKLIRAFTIHNFKLVVKFIVGITIMRLNVYLIENVSMKQVIS